MARREEDLEDRRKRAKQPAPMSWRPRPFTRARLNRYAARKGESRSAIIERAVRRLLDEERDG